MNSIVVIFVCDDDVGANDKQYRTLIALADATLVLKEPTKASKIR